MCEAWPPELANMLATDPLEQRERELSIAKMEEEIRNMRAPSRRFGSPTVIVAVLALLASLGTLYFQYVNATISAREAEIKKREIALDVRGLNLTKEENLDAIDKARLKLEIAESRLAKTEVMAAMNQYTQLIDGGLRSITLSEGTPLLAENGLELVDLGSSRREVSEKNGALADVRRRMSHVTQPSDRTELLRRALQLIANKIGPTYCCIGRVDFREMQELLNALSDGYPEHAQQMHDELRVIQDTSDDRRMRSFKLLTFTKEKQDTEKREQDSGDAEQLFKAALGDSQSQSSSTR